MDGGIEPEYIVARDIGVGDIVVGFKENPPSQGYTVTSVRHGPTNARLEFAGVPGYQLQKLSRRVWVYKIKKGITQHG